MARPRKAQKAAALQAWAGKAIKQNKFNVEDVEAGNAGDTESEEDTDIECTHWTGGVNHTMSDSDSDDEIWEDTHLVVTCSDDESDVKGDEDFDLEELEGQELIEGLKKHWELELDLQALSQLTPYELLSEKQTSQEWKSAESNWPSLHLSAKISL
jgi:hypothetical protein